MRLKVTTLWIVFVLQGCDINSIGPYYNLGEFTNRTISEQKALEYLVSRFAKLSSGDYEKVKYHFEPSKPNTGTRHAIWYSRRNQELKLEVDLGSGTCASWTGISQTVLDQMVRANKGLSTADSLGKSTGVSYFDCVGN
jgi:hypothetical protein